MTVEDINAIEPIMENQDEEMTDDINVKGRNSRRPKKANHGARPCSSYMRKMKQKGWYHIVKAKEWAATQNFFISITDLLIFTKHY